MCVYVYIYVSVCMCVCMCVDSNGCVVSRMCVCALIMATPCIYIHACIQTAIDDNIAALSELVPDAVFLQSFGVGKDQLDMLLQVCVCVCVCV
jgi:hypothetical protein